MANQDFHLQLYRQSLTYTSKYKIRIMSQKTFIISDIDSGNKDSKQLKISNAMSQRPTKIIKSFQKIQLQTSNDKLNELLQIYSWRSKSQKPIVKIIFYKVLQNNQYENSNMVQVTYQSFNIYLSDLKQISLGNVLYLMKQALQGFQILYHKFGSFLVSNRMIALNKNQKCKVWINQNFSINEPISVQMFKNQSQKAFIDQILTLFEKKCQRVMFSQILFENLLPCQKFQELINKINEFSKIYNIQIPTSYKLEQKLQRKFNQSKSPIKPLFEKPKNNYDVLMNRPLPRFLNKTNVQDKLNNLTQKSIINQNRHKSRSVSPNNIRNRTPINPRTQALMILNKNSDKTNHKNLNITKNNFKTFMKISHDNTYVSKDYWSIKDIGDDQLQMKKKFSIQTRGSLNFNANNNNMISSSNSLNPKQSQDTIFEGKKLNKKNTKTSDLNTAYSNTSILSNLKLKQKLSVDDKQSNNMFQSIVIGQDQEMKKSSCSTFDLEKLSKLGKHIGSSLMPQDFQNYE